MKKSKRTVALVLAMVAIMAVTLTGCKEKLIDGMTFEDAANLAKTYAGQIIQKDEQLAAMQDSLDKANGTVDTRAGDIVNMEVGTGRTFNILGGKIWLPIDVGYPTAVATPTDMAVSLSKEFSVVPNSNWEIVLGKNVCTMYHNSGITVKFKVEDVGDFVTPDDLEAGVLTELVNSVPNYGVDYGRLFYNGSELGAHVNFGTSIDNNAAQMRAAVFGSEDESLVWTSVYEGDFDSTKEELLDKLFGTVKYGMEPIETD